MKESTPHGPSLTSLEALDRAALAQRWLQVFGHPAPKGSRSLLLRLALGWQLQMVELHPATADPARLLKHLRQSAAPAVGTTLSPGTRLLREWQGQTHNVMVLAHGFEHQGKTYRSLSAIARHITGTAWSGPLFFGLRR